jgi:hypothetical protein
MDERRVRSCLRSRREDIDAAGWAIIFAVAARPKNRFAGIVPADFRSVRNVSKRISGVSATGPPGFARTARG